MANTNNDYAGVYPFSRVWELVDGVLSHPFPKELVRYQAAFDDSLLSRELLVSIFWEETLLRNVGQEPVGPAIGFGQVEEKTRKRVLEYFKNDLNEQEWTKPKILADLTKSVELPVLVLCHLWDIKAKSLPALLRIYAGYDEVPTEVKPWLEPSVKAAKGNMAQAWHTQRQTIINGWLACRDKLQKIGVLQRKPQVLTQRSDEALNVIRQVIHALNLARPFCNLCYNAFDSDAKPPIGPPNFLGTLPLIQKAFPNVTVKFNPTTINKWGPDGPQLAFV
jgi:hypothetical protein